MLNLSDIAVQDQHGVTWYLVKPLSTYADIDPAILKNYSVQTIINNKMRTVISLTQIQQVARHTKNHLLAKIAKTPVTNKTKPNTQPNFQVNTVTINNAKHRIREAPNQQLFIQDIAKAVGTNPNNLLKYVDPVNQDQFMATANDKIQRVTTINQQGLKQIAQRIKTDRLKPILELVKPRKLNKYNVLQYDPTLYPNAVHLTPEDKYVHPARINRINNVSQFPNPNMKGYLSNKTIKYIPHSEDSTRNVKRLKFIKADEFVERLVKTINIPEVEHGGFSTAMVDYMGVGFPLFSQAQAWQDTANKPIEEITMADRKRLKLTSLTNLPTEVFDRDHPKFPNLIRAVKQTNPELARFILTFCTAEGDVHIGKHQITRFIPVIPKDTPHYLQIQYIPIVLSLSQGRIYFNFMFNTNTLITGQNIIGVDSVKRAFALAIAYMLQTLTQQMLTGTAKTLKRGTHGYVPEYLANVLTQTNNYKEISLFRLDLAAYTPAKINEKDNFAQAMHNTFAQRNFLGIDEETSPIPTLNHVSISPSALYNIGSRQFNNQKTTMLTAYTPTNTIAATLKFYDKDQELQAKNLNPSPIHQGQFRVELSAKSAYLKAANIKNLADMFEFEAKHANTAQTLQALAENFHLQEFQQAALGQCPLETLVTNPDIYNQLKQPDTPEYLSTHAKFVKAAKLLLKHLTSHYESMNLNFESWYEVLKNNPLDLSQFKQLVQDIRTYFNVKVTSILESYATALMYHAAHAEAVNTEIKTRPQEVNKHQLTQEPTTYQPIKNTNQPRELETPLKSAPPEYIPVDWVDSNGEVISTQSHFPRINNLIQLVKTKHQQPLPTTKPNTKKRRPEVELINQFLAA
jgi:hypothetical protein